MRREEKSLRISVHLANGVVWGPVLPFLAAQCNGVRPSFLSDLVTETPRASTSHSHARRWPPPAAQCSAPLPYASTVSRGSKPAPAFFSAATRPSTSPAAAAASPAHSVSSLFFFSLHGAGRPAPLPRQDELSAFVEPRENAPLPDVFFPPPSRTPPPKTPPLPIFAAASSSVSDALLAASAAAAHACVVPPLAQCCLNPPPCMA
eukprot:31519-Pelagococcus_subviridis.AAC.14